VSGWSDGQAKGFAKRIAARYQAAWFVLTNDLREAVVSEFVLLVVLGQEKVAVNVEDVRELRQAVCRHLATRHKMMTEAAEAEELAS
jgi:hypothetical protein